MTREEAFAPEREAKSARSCCADNPTWCGLPDGHVGNCYPGTLADLAASTISPAPWFAGLTFEEVHTQILIGKAPGSGRGGGVLVPEGFLNWLVSRKALPVLSERPDQCPHCAAELNAPEGGCFRYGQQFGNPFTDKLELGIGAPNAKDWRLGRFRCRNCGGEWIVSKKPGGMLVTDPAQEAK